MVVVTDRIDTATGSRPKDIVYDRLSACPDILEIKKTKYLINMIGTWSGHAWHWGFEP